MRPMLFVIYIAFLSGCGGGIQDFDNEVYDDEMIANQKWRIERGPLDLSSRFDDPLDTTWIFELEGDADYWHLAVTDRIETSLSFMVSANNDKAYNLRWVLYMRGDNIFTGERDMKMLSRLAYGA